MKIKETCWCSSLIELEADNIMYINTKLDEWHELHKECKDGYYVQGSALGSSTTNKPHNIGFNGNI